jgi:hypothetical protein
MLFFRLTNKKRRKEMNVIRRHILATIVLVISITFSARVLAESTTQHYHPKGKMPSKYTVHWRIFIFSAILALMGLFCTPQLDAEIYQWVDENGVKHYSNTPPAKTENAKIVSGEYKHDEAADQERVKADQKQIDTLTETIKKEEQQPKAAEEAKAAEDTKADADCYLKANVDVRVIVWHADRSGNKGVKIWEGVLKKGERKLIHTPDGNIRYAHRRNLADDQYFSGDKNRYCENGQEISVP